ncbi:uncharacterized protein LOC106066904 [Biomphalaria glabrata]|uniref:Uncharacterized protein LOC106066904 n=1 Tax=Biomphalaria glabrata TaxID=6526 RepID=A0A9W2YRB6_BIOGL|nr:uncharacterized protein LOC106066904 [Biomphalaria glabrata]
MRTTGINETKRVLILTPRLLPCVVSKVINLYPEEILPGITPKLTINCSLTHKSVPYLTVINSLTLSRYNVTNHEFDAVLSLDTRTLSVQHFVERQEAEITSGSQFLALTLHNPTQNDAEIYRCDVDGQNALGKNQSFVEKSQVKVLNNLTTYIEEMKRLRKIETEFINMKSIETCSQTNNSKQENSRLNFSGNSKIVKEYIQPLSLKCSFQTKPKQTPFLK